MNEYDPDRLSDALGQVSGWSAPSTVGATSVHHGYRRLSVVTRGRRQSAAEPFAFVLDDFDPIWKAWLSQIDPGGFIRPHSDAGPWYERWHVPVQPAGWFRQGQETFVPIAGHPFRVMHWVEHELGNPTDRPRIHLVIDRVNVALEGRENFQVLGTSVME